MVKLINVNKSYGNKVILDNINYKFASRGIYLLKGESGVGKTTLLKIISGISNCNGQVIVNGDVFFLPFNDYLIDELKVFEMMNLENEIYLKNKKFRDILNIGELKNKKCSKLSLGEKQRLGIYLAISSNSKIVLLDEPLAGLDKKYRNKVISLIKKESRKRLFIVVSHDFSISNSEIRLELKNGKLIGETSLIDINDIDVKCHNKKVSNNWGLVLHFKQIISRLIFLISCVGVLSFVNDINSQSGSLINDFNNSFINERIYYKKNIEKLDEEIFYDVIVSSLNNEIEDYYVYGYSKEMYESEILVNGYYLDNGFLFSSSTYVEGLNSDEVIIEVNKNEFCSNNKLFYCDDYSIKEALSDSYLVYEYDKKSIDLKVKDVIIGEENSLFIGDLEKLNSQLNLLHDNLYYKYLILINNDKLDDFYNKVNSMTVLENYDFIEVYKDQYISSFMVEVSETSYFNLKEINDNSLVACTDIGHSCNVFDFYKFKSLVFINDINLENEVNYKKTNEQLNLDEIIISSGLSSKLGNNIGERISLKFYFDDKYHVLKDVKIIDIVEDDDLTIYHSDYDYNLFIKEFNKQVRVKYVYSDKYLEEYDISNSLFYDDLESISLYINGMIDVISIVVYIFAFFMILIMFLIEGNKLKRHKDFFRLLSLKKVEYINIFKVYMGFYFISSIIFVFDIVLFISYLFIVSVFYNIESKKIRSLVGP